MGKHLYYFRPGEEARMLARCQFGLSSRGCGVVLTYPIKGFPWRNNIMKSYDFDLDKETEELLFNEVHRIKLKHASECLNGDQLWNDSSEKANAITRDRETNTLCYSIAIHSDEGGFEVQYSMREDSYALLDSELYKTISTLIKPYEFI